MSNSKESTKKKGSEIMRLTQVASPGAPELETLLAKGGISSDESARICSIAAQNPEEALVLLARYCGRQRRVIDMRERAYERGIEVLEADNISLLAERNTAYQRHGALSAELETRRDTERRIRAESERDSLTGLYNRRKFDADLEKAVEEQTPFAVIYGDARMFKRINDTYGHSIGDLALKAIARTLQQMTRTETAVYRIGGDEFAILEKGVSLEVTHIIEDRLQKAGMNVHVRAGSGKISVAYDVGAVHYCPTDKNIENISEKLKAHADREMYNRKEAIKRGELYLVKVEFDPEKSLDKYLSEMQLLTQARTKKEEAVSLRESKYLPCISDRVFAGISRLAACVGSAIIPASLYSAK